MKDVNRFLAEQALEDFCKEVIRVLRLEELTLYLVRRMDK